MFKIIKCVQNKLLTKKLHSYRPPPKATQDEMRLSIRKPLFSASVFNHYIILLVSIQMHT